MIKLAWSKKVAATNGRDAQKPKPLNVLLLESTLGEGGAEAVTCSIIRKADQARIRFTIGTFYEAGYFGKILISEGFSVFSNLFRSKYDIRGLEKLRRMIRKEAIDVIFIINQPVTLFWGFVAAKLCSVPIISAIHNTYVSSEEPKLRIYRLLLPFVDRIVAVAETQKHHLVENEGIPGNRVEVVYNGVDAEKCERCATEEREFRYFLQEGVSKKVAMVARLVHLKGADVFLGAAMKVLERRKDVDFVIVGDGPEMENLKRLARELGIASNVQFLGFRRDVRRILESVDIGVLPSRTEALPMAVLEYMASGKPVVATRVGSVHELIRHGVNGFLVDANDSSALAEKILFLLANGEKAKEMGRRGKDIVHEEFSIEATVRNMENLIERVAEKRAAAIQSNH